ncbi:hypothetical protein [uncultured Methanobrevibacter sp.]|uniref:hypothetical protein n=1 Tax=uncultured Methanobrevibacter sp. TaxID=253161 RepID=UPI002617A99F|nr:hypothetical protein [uncultured Methanobrevibacter sp.]
MSSRSATVLVIFIVACVAFCFATVFASMTGPISILPNESSGGVLDNLSAITDSDDNYNTYGYDDSNDQSSYNYDDSSDDKQVETTTEDSPSESQKNQEDSNVEKTTEPSQSSSSGSWSSSNVETTSVPSDK